MAFTVFPRVKSMTRTINPVVRAERAKGLFAGENAILEMIALDAPLADVLDRLMRLTETRFCFTFGSGGQTLAPCRCT
jgi:hypothetical protein